MWWTCTVWFLVGVILLVTLPLTVPSGNKITHQSPRVPEAGQIEKDVVPSSHWLSLRRSHSLSSVAIPRHIYQTWKTREPEVLHKTHLQQIMPDMDYTFFDDDMIETFIQEEYDKDTLTLFQKLNVGAAKADLWRYMIMYKRGGVYLDVDSDILTSLDPLLNSGADVVLAAEPAPSSFFVQWALIAKPGHDIFRLAVELALFNIKHEHHPHDVHKATGPAVLTQAIEEYIHQQGLTGIHFCEEDYAPFLKFKQGGLIVEDGSGEYWMDRQRKTSIYNHQ